MWIRGCGVIKFNNAESKKEVFLFDQQYNFFAIVLYYRLPFQKVLARRMTGV